MRRTLASQTKVIRSTDQPLAKMALPNPVRHHPGGQRIGRIRQPIGKFKPTGARHDRQLLLPSQDRRKSLLDQITLRLGIPAQKYSLLHRLAFRHRAGKRRLGRSRRLDRFQLRLQRCNLLASTLGIERIRQ